MRLSRTLSAGRRGSQAYGPARPTGFRSHRRAPGRRSGSCTLLRAPSSRRSRMAGRPTRTSRRRSRSTGASGVKGTVRVANETGIEQFRHHRVLDAGRPVGTRDPDGVRLHEVPNRALVLIHRPRSWSRTGTRSANVLGGELRLGADLRHLDDRCAEDHFPYVANLQAGLQFTRDDEPVRRRSQRCIGHRRRHVPDIERAKWNVPVGNGVVEARPKTNTHVLCGTDDYLPRASRIFAGA